MQEIAPFKKELRGGACPQTPLTTVRSIAARDMPHEKSYIRPCCWSVTSSLLHLNQFYGGQGPSQYVDGKSK